MWNLNRKVKEFIRNHPGYKRVFTGRRALFRSSNDVTYDQGNKVLTDHATGQTYHVKGGRHFIEASVYVSQKIVFIVENDRKGVM